MRDDFGLALRSLLRTPVFAILVTGSIALGIGACTIAFAVIDAVEFRSLPFHSSGNLAIIQLFRSGPECRRVCRSGLTQSEFEDWRRSLALTDALAEIRAKPAIISDRAGAAIGEGAALTTNLLSLLGVQPALGRRFDALDEAPASANVVILSDALWHTRYGGDPSILGQMIRLDSSQFQIVGILPPNARIGRPLFNGDTLTSQFFVPLKRTPDAIRVRDIDPGVLVARLRSGGRVATLRAQVGVALARANAVFVPAAAGNDLRTSVVQSLRAAHAQAVEAGSYRLLLSVVAVVLALIWANTLGTFLARLYAQLGQLQTRRALGCSSARLVQYCAAEGILCTVSGGIIGVLCAVPLLSLGSRLPPFSLPFWTSFTLDWRVLSVSAAAVVVTAAIVGIAPGVAVVRQLARTSWRYSSGPVPSSRRMFSQQLVLVALQIQIALVLLTAAGLLAKTYADAQTRDLGMARHSILMLRLSATNATTRMMPEEQEALCSTLIRRLKQIPGVSSAAARLSGRPVYDVRPSGSAPMESAPLPISPDLITSAFFRTWSIPVLDGRAFTDDDSAGDTRVAILDKETAMRFFPDGRAIGQRIALGDSVRGVENAMVVGVVGTTQRSVFAHTSTPFYPTIYLPLAQASPTGSQLTFIIHTRGPASGQEPLVRAAAHEVAPSFPVVSLGSFERELDSRTADARLNAVLVASLAITALVLASLGVCALVARVVAGRLREAGIRIALGATRGHVRLTMMAPALSAACAGAAFGVVSAMAISRLMRAFLYGQSPFDPWVFGLAIMVLGSAATIAAYVPARRATRVEPSAALRST